jgi:hypothetical protein
VRRRRATRAASKKSSCINLTELKDEDRHQSYLRFDQTKTWALETRAQDVMDKVTRHNTAKTQVSRDRTFEFYGTGNTSVPGIGVDKDDSRTLKSR